MTTINYHAPETVSRLMRSDAYIRLIAGPIGSGKTTGLIFELLRRALMQSTSLDGLRYTRFAIARQTLSQLKQTVLKDITYWLSGVARWKVSESTVYINFGDVRSEWILIPLEEPEDQRRLLSMQLTGAWLSEGIELARDLVDPIAARCGRFPGAGDGGATWNGVIIDTNMPPEGTPWHETMVMPPKDWEVFIQPGGLTPEAENLNWLLQTPETLKLPIDNPIRVAAGRRYYERAAQSRNENWVKRYVHAQFSPDPSGTAVFAGSFRYPFHTVDSLEPMNGMTLYVGQDFGRDPWSIICQMDMMGRFRALEEVRADDIGLRTHLRNNLRPALLNPRYKGMAVVVIGDPAGIAKSQYDEINAFDVLRQEGFSAIPAGANDLDSRLNAVEYYLLQQRAGGPAMVFDRKRCPTLVQAMNGQYRYSKTNLEVSKPMPDKNRWSHVSDALQYGAMGTMGNTARQVARLLRGTRSRTRQLVTAAGWT
jgi:hypothetical protein